MGCSDSSEDKMYLAKLSRLEIQVKKQKELEKLAKIEGKSIEDMNYLSLSKPSNTEPNSSTKGTKTTKDTKITIKKKKRNNSENNNNSSDKEILNNNNKELKEETGRIKILLSQSKEKLANITLYEKQKSDIDIYQWNNLFNQSIPITSYVASSAYIKKQNEKLKKEENKNMSEIKEEKKEKETKHPIVLVDLTEEEMKKYLPPDPTGIPSSNVIRFQQLPFKGGSNEVFYFSNSFNDYYKMDFKQFIQRMPILKAKKRCESAKLNRQIKETKKKNREEELQREYIKNQMLNRLNNLYIEKQYLSLSNNANNIQPLMSSIHAQIYPGRGDELTKHDKIYIKSNKPLGSERDINNIDYSINERDYQRTELRRLKGIKNIKYRPKSTTKKRRLRLSRYNINDPDIAIFKKVEMLNKIENEDEININDNKFINNSKEQFIMDNDLNKLEEIKKKEDFNKNIKENPDIEKTKNNINKETFSMLNDGKNTGVKTPNLIHKNLNTQEIRALSAKRDYYKKEENINNNNKFKRAMSAQGLRVNNRNAKPFIHKVYLSSKSRIYNSAFQKNFAKKQRNKISTDLYDEKNRGNSSSQISTYEGINSSKYENQNPQRYAFPLKNNHQVENKIYQKINKRLKEKNMKKMNLMVKLSLKN